MSEEYVSETFKQNGYTVKIVQDLDPIDPRKDDFDFNVGTMVCWHSRYNLGDERTHKGDDPEEWRLSLVEEVQPGFGERWDNQMYKRMVQSPQKITLLRSYDFKDTQYDTAAWKARVLQEWVRFLARGCRFEDFTKHLYTHLIQHCSFIAHYDRSGFYATYFNDRDSRLRFLSQFTEWGDCRSVEYGDKGWLTREDYADLNRALVTEAAPYIKTLVVGSVDEQGVESEAGREKKWRAARREAMQKILDKHFLMLPLRLYDHSGITMSVGSGPSPFDTGGWDSGQVGWIYCSKEKALGELTCTGKDWKEAAEKCLTQEVETYDQYLTGDVYGYVIETPDGEEVASCFGYFGEKSCIEEAKGAVPSDPALSEEEEDQFEERLA